MREKLKTWNWGANDIDTSDNVIFNKSVCGRLCSHVTHDKQHLLPDLIKQVWTSTNQWNQKKAGKGSNFAHTYRLRLAGK